MFHVTRMRFFLLGMFGEIDYFLYAITPLIVLWMLVRPNHRDALREGDGRRKAFTPGPKAHPKPSIPWNHNCKLKYKQGLVSVNALKIWYQYFSSHGGSANELIIMFHGYGDHSDYILHEIAHDLALKTGKGVIVFDQPGFGRSDGLWAYIPDWFRHVELCVAATRAIVSKLTCNNNPARLIGYGHSMGGVNGSYPVPEHVFGSHSICADVWYIPISAASFHD